MQPYAGLVQASDGNFYGTTLEGGSNNGCSLGSGSCGTVFKITPGGTLTTLHSFCSQPNCTDGGNPYAGLVQASDGNFYGTTFERGANGDGTVFKITPGGTLTTLYSFCSQPNCADGSIPYAELVQATDGNFYGTTTQGAGAYGNGGTVFKISPQSPYTLTSLYSFCSQPNCTDGDDPIAGLVQASDGNFYGTTQQGGGTNCSNNPNHCGTVFKMTPAGGLTTLYRFDGSDGKWPIAGLVQATDGNFYGTTYTGGAYNFGTVFELQVPVTYTLTVSKAGTGSGTVTSSDGFINCGNVCSYTYNNGTQVKLTATPSQGSSFTSWSGCDSTSGDSCMVTMNSARNVTATFTQLIYTLSVTKAGTGLGTVTSSDGFINCGKVCSYNYDSGTEVTLTATPSPGSSFSSWSGCDSSSGNSCTVTMNSSRTATATFTLQAGYYKLSVSTSGGGTVTSTDGFINCPGNCNYVYQSNTQVTLNATPSSGWTFVGWNGACSGTGACNVTMTQSLSVGASFIFGVAVYNATLGAPECAVAGRSCDSGPSLLLGRDNMAGGAEPNQPNTIHNSCADGTAGIFHVDESMDRLVVATTNGLSMTQGSIVKISATVWVADTTQDALDLYYATNANNPTWIYIATLVPRAKGSQTLSALYRVGPGHLQAVRANFRKGGTRSACSPGDYDDHDDLVFVVR